MSLVLSSTRPVQSIMGICGFVAAVGVITAQQLCTWTPMDDLIHITGYYCVVAMFLIYSILSEVSAVFNFYTPPFKLIKYIATEMGIALWTICLASSLAWNNGSLVLRDGMSFLYLIPLLADTWVLIQMIASVEKIERRLWK